MTHFSRSLIRSCVGTAYVFATSWMEQNFCNKQPIQSVFRFRKTVKVLGHLLKMPSTVSCVRRTFVSIAPTIPDCEKSLFALAQIRTKFVRIAGKVELDFDERGGIVKECLSPTLGFGHGSHGLSRILAKPSQKEVNKSRPKSKKGSAFSCKLVKHPALASHLSLTGGVREVHVSVANCLPD